MPKACIICGKSAIPGVKYKRRGAKKLHGGAGSKITGKTMRRFFPNLQRIKIIREGVVRRSLVCTSCIQAEKITKA